MISNQLRLQLCSPPVLFCCCIVSVIAELVFILRLIHLDSATSRILTPQILGSRHMIAFKGKKKFCKNTKTITRYHLVLGSRKIYREMIN
jgi:hypothetical protein